MYVTLRVNVNIDTQLLHATAMQEASAHKYAQLADPASVIMLLKI